MAIRHWSGGHPVNIGAKLWNAVHTNYYLGFTSFGGPPVHFKIVSYSFVLMIMFHRDVYCVLDRATADECPHLSFMTNSSRNYNGSTSKWYVEFSVVSLGTAAFLISMQYQELFSVCQAFSGPGSTKMHYCINLIHDGFPPALLGFFFWR